MIRSGSSPCRYLSVLLDNGFGRHKETFGQGFFNPLGECVLIVSQFLTNLVYADQDTLRCKLLYLCPKSRKNIKRVMHTMRLYEEIGIKNITTGHTLSFDDYFINKIGVYIAKQSCQFECIFVGQCPAFNSAIDITGKSRTYPTLVGTIEISTTRLLLFLEASSFHI